MGDFATVALPGSDLTALDFRRMNVKVIVVPNGDIYTLQWVYGILDLNVGTSSLDVMHKDIVRRVRHTFDNAPTKKITLHRAARLESKSDWVAINCNCKKRGKTINCTCHKNNKRCGQNCHGDEINCGNMLERIIDCVYRLIVSDNDAGFASASASPPRERAATHSSHPKSPSKESRKQKDGLYPLLYPLRTILSTPLTLYPTEDLHAG